MAKNPSAGDGRVGAVREPFQAYNPHNHTWVKRDTETGHFIGQKVDPSPLRACTRRSDMACAFAHRVVAGAAIGIAIAYKESQTGESTAWPFVGGGLGALLGALPDMET